MLIQGEGGGVAGGTAALASANNNAKKMTNLKNGRDGVNWDCAQLLQALSRELPLP